MRNYFALMAALTLFAMPINVEASRYIRTYGTVEHVDHNTKEITVKDTAGATQKFIADWHTEVEVEYRARDKDHDTTFSEVKVGDHVEIKAYTPKEQGQTPVIKDLEISR